MSEEIPANINNINSSDNDSKHDNAYTSKNNANNDDNNNNSNNNTNTSSSSNLNNNAISLNVRFANGTKFGITLPNNGGVMTIENTKVIKVKEHLSSLSETDNCPVHLQRVIYKGKILDNERTLSDYGIVNDATIFLVKSAAPSAGSGSGGTTSVRSSNSSVSSATTTASVKTPTTGVGASVPSSSMPAISPRQEPTLSNAVSNDTGVNSPMSGFPSMPGSFPPAIVGSNNSNNNNPSSNLFGANPFGTGAGGGMDPSELLNNPLVQNILDSNPDFLRNMMRSQLESNPALQQLMESNPAVRHMLSDPAQFDEMIRMIRNPSAMQQIMRSQDLALSQIENMPGGFAALSNMYETMQRPLEESLAEGRINNDSSTTNHRTGDGMSANNDGATGAAMPNPWGSSGSRSINPSPGRASATASTPDPFLTSMLSGMGNNSHGGAIPTSNPFERMMMGGDAAGNPLGGQQQLPSMDQRQAALNMLQSNPGMLAMMQQFIRTNPGMIRQMIAQQVATDPMASMMFQNLSDDQFVEYMTQMMNPEAMNRIAQMEQQLRSLGMNTNSVPGVHSAPPILGNPFFSFAPPSALMPNSNVNSSNPWANIGNGSSASSNATTSNMNSSSTNPNFPTHATGSTGLDFSGLLSGMAFPSPTPQRMTSLPTTTPAEQYRVQLRSLYDMGFDDEVRNLEALQASRGNLNGAVDLLLSGSVPAASTLSVTATTADTSHTSNNNGSPNLNNTSVSPIERTNITDVTSNESNNNNEQPSNKNEPKNIEDKKND